LGTEFDVSLADGSVIEAVAADVGGAIKGRKLDVLMRNRAEAIEFGRQEVGVRMRK
jgi:3D (Asp-Asp-Asp) domain-containing protein